MDLPSFAGWTNEEIGAFMRGLEYIDGGNDVREILAGDATRSPLSEEQPEAVEAIPGFGQRLSTQETAEVYTKMADFHWRRLFGNQAQPIITQIAADSKPWMDLITSGELEDDELVTALSKLVLLAACDGALALEHRPVKKGKRK